MSPRRLGKIVAVLLVAAGFVGSVLAPSAGAHVTVSDTEQVAGSYGLLTFSVPHGCAGSPTTEVRIKIPEAIIDVTPSVNPNWDVDTITVALDDPVVDGHGEEVTERIEQVVYTARTPLPDDLRDAFELSLPIPDMPGETLYFPTVQKCEEGETAWIQIPGAGESGDGLDEPAPAVEVVPASADASDSADADAEAAEAAVDAGGESDDDPSSNGLAIAALIIAIVAVAIGGVSLVVGRSGR